MENSLIYGTLLGDSWIYKDPKGYYLFAFSQANEEYAKWKAELLGYEYREYKRVRFDKRTNKWYSNLTIHMKIPLEEKKRIHSVFYTPKKGVTQEILDQLNDQGICLWYLDDGSVYYNSNNCHISLATDGFTEKERELIKEWFKSKYNINFKNSQKSIRLTSKKDCEIFMKIVERYIPKCMEHKKLSQALEKYSKSLTKEKMNRRYKKNRIL